MKSLLRYLFAFVLAAALIASPLQAAPVSSQAQPAADGQATNQLIVRFADNRGLSLMNNAAAQAALESQASAAAGIEVAYLREMTPGTHVLSLPRWLPDAEAQAVAERLAQLPGVESAEPDRLLTIWRVPNDPEYSKQWDLKAPGVGNYGINMPAAWDLSTGSASVVVAVVDTGITNHADLSGRTVPGYDFITDPLIANDGGGRDPNPADPGDWAPPNFCPPYKNNGPIDSSWHGTHVAGIIAANGDNSLGVSGINWQAKILPVRVLGRCGGHESDVIDGMRWAAGRPVSGVPANPNPAKVINISLGGFGVCGSVMQEAVSDVIAAGATLVVAAGNSSADASLFRPANCSGVITVGATTRGGSRAYYSNYGSVVDISAPGGETIDDETDGILSTLNTGKQGPVSDTYQHYQGTSMAAPHVSGIISLMLSRNPTLLPGEVQAILKSPATKFPTGSDCNTSICGSGIANAAAAVSTAAAGLNLQHRVSLPIVRH